MTGEYMKLNTQFEDHYSNINLSSTKQSMQTNNIFVSEKTIGTKNFFKECMKKDPSEFISICEDKTVPLTERYAAAQMLALIGDPRINGDNPTMISIPSATVKIGLEFKEIDQIYEKYKNIGVEKEWIEKESPSYYEDLRAFNVSKYLVTNFEYLQFLLDVKHGEVPSSWPFGIFQAWNSNHPVYTISYESVLSYIEWLNKKTKRKFRLLTEAEWEYAASNGIGQEFPWGNEFHSEYANTLEGGFYAATPVGIFAEGYSKNGIADLAGNVEEYVANHYKPYPGGREIIDDLYKVNHGKYQIARGGSFTRYSDLARSKRRHGFFPKEIYAIGFRLAEDLEE